MDSEFNTPILLLIFNRFEVTQKVFDQIKLVKPKYLFVASDGPRPGREDDIQNIRQTQNIINQVNWECNVKTLFRDKNLGCGLAVSSAISWFFENVDDGIILEDDCFPDVSFFYFCRDLLNLYKDDESIYVISGMNRQNGIKRGSGSYYFSNYPATWGWATWRRAWKYFDYDIPDVNQLFESDHLNQVFQSSSEKKYWWKKMQLVDTEKKNIWDYQWRYSVWKQKGLGIIPNSNLIINLGTQNLPTHVFLKDSMREPSEFNSITFPLIHPRKNIDKEADLYMFKNSFSHSFKRILRLINENGMTAIIKYVILKFGNKF